MKNKRRNLMMVFLPTLPELIVNVPLIIFIVVNPYQVLDRIEDLTNDNAFYSALFSIAWLPFCLPYYLGVTALYAVSVRRLIALRSGFLQTPPRGDALAFG
jgi:uncharacterized BrkB/YihY/UPF0761 family membrane protein